MVSGGPGDVEARAERDYWALVLGLVVCLSVFFSLV